MFVLIKIRYHKKQNVAHNIPPGGKEWNQVTAVCCHGDTGGHPKTPLSDASLATEQTNKQTNRQTSVSCLCRLLKGVCLVKSSESICLVKAQNFQENKSETNSSFIFG